MTRVFTRAIMLTAVGGLALAPAIACAADTTTSQAPPSTTVIQLVKPKDPQANQSFTLSARVSPKGADDTENPVHASTTKKPGGDTKGKGKAKGGKGRSGGKGATHKRHAAETGAVVFTVDGKTQAPVPVSRGRASEKLDLTSGKHTVTAAYSGDDNYTASQSAPLTFDVS
jgi:hypothetical protein